VSLESAKMFLDCIKRLTKEERLSIAVGLGLIFLTAEVVGGILSNSLAVIADAAHLATDVGGFMVALVATKMAKKDATETYSFGYSRLEVLSALVSTLLLWAVTVWLVVEAVQRAVRWSRGDGEYVDGKLMFGIACFGIL
jgi:zinc transporter 2